MARWLVCIVVAVCSGGGAQAQEVAVQSQLPSCATAIRLTPEAAQVAGEIGITAQVARLQVLGAGCHPAAASSIEEVALRQQITDAVIAASLDVDQTLAQIDYERAQIFEKRAVLSNQKNRTVNLLSLANIVAGTGSGIITNAMQYSNSTALTGDGIGVGGGAAGVLLSILGLRVQGGNIALGIAPNMLAEIFDRAPEAHSVYPPDVWAWLNARPAAYPRVPNTWRQQLIEDWVRVKRIGPPDEPASQQKIQLLTSTIAERTRLPMGLLQDRSVMLLDLSARVALMQGALRDLLNGVRGTPPH